MEGCKPHKPLEITIKVFLRSEEKKCGMSLAEDTPPVINARPKPTGLPTATYDHILDPLGDVIFTLESPNAPFAVWPVVNSDKSYPSAAELVATESVLSHEPVTFLVSSRHLILASLVLKAALTGGWKESVARETDGLLEISTEGWDVEAMAIIMSILHHKWSQVPQEVDLELLAKIAIVVDYYQIYEVVQLIGKIWVERLRTALPDSYRRELILWLCISSVFRDNEVFRHVTRVAIRHCPRDLETLQLPIPSAIVGRFPFSWDGPGSSL